MGPKPCVKYGLKADVYPRFAHFQKRLESIVPRFESVLDEAKLWSCISEGKVKLREIAAVAKHMTDFVKVTVMGSKIDVLQSFEQELRVWNDEFFTAKKELVTWTKALSELEWTMRFDPCFMLYLMESPTPEMVKDLAGQFSSLNYDQLHNVIIYDTGTKKNYPYIELLDLAGTTTLPENDRNQSVSQQIQYLLEDRAVEVLEMVLNYTNNFVPKAGVEPDQSLLDECSTKVLESLRCQHVLDDLDPDKAVSQEEDVMETDSSSPGTSLQFDSITGIKSQIVDKDAIFLEKLTDFLCKKTKCILCDNLAKKYGISSSLVNEFMNEEYHGYENKYRAACSNLPRSHWSDVKTGKRANVLNYSYVIRQSSLFHESEAYIKEKMVVLREMAKLAFELHALLRETVTPVSVMIPSYPRLTENLQNMLLDLPEVHGCGTMYGKLTLHVKKELTPSATRTVRDILDQFKYMHAFDVQLVAETVKQAGPTPVKVEVGNELQATLTDESFRKLKQENDKKTPKVPTNREKSGSLGCFVKLSKVSGNGDNVSNKHLYCVTCAHCVTGCHSEVKVRTGNKFRDFGRADSHIDDGERLDIAVVKVDENQIANCNTCICVFNKDWRLYDGPAGDIDLSGRVVYKRGYQTGETTGIVSCNDYRMKRMEAWNQNTNTNFDGVYNILVDVEPGSGPGATFSRGGDSGSAVYYQLNSKDGLNNTITVVSLVQGSMTHNNKYQCTYTCHMKRSLLELCQRFGFKLEEPGQGEMLYMQHVRGN